jgi:hypothetical protein
VSPLFSQCVLSTCVWLRSSLSRHPPSFAPRLRLIEGCQATLALITSAARLDLRACRRARRVLHGTLRQRSFRLRSRSQLPRSVTPTTALVEGPPETTLRTARTQFPLASPPRVTVETGPAQSTIRNIPGRLQPALLRFPTSTAAAGRLCPRHHLIIRLFAAVLTVRFSCFRPVVILTTLPICLSATLLVNGVLRCHPCFHATLCQLASGCDRRPHIVAHRSLRDSR